jgi:hypothetical protein
MPHVSPPSKSVAWRQLALAFGLFAVFATLGTTVASAFYVDDHETHLVSRTEAGELPSEIGNDGTALFDVSDDGRYLLLGSNATNFPVGNVPAGEEVVGESALFRKDRQTGGLALVARPSRQDSTTEALTFCGSLPSGGGGISADGRYVAFVTAEKLVAADTNFNKDVYVRDMSKAIGATKAGDEAGAWELVSARDGGDTPASYALNATECGEESTIGGNLRAGKTISDDGRHVVFTASRSDLPNLGPEEAPGNSLFWRDLDADKTRTVAREVFDAGGSLLAQTDAGLPVGTLTEPQSTPLGTVVISGDGSKVAWVGKYAPTQVRVMEQEYGSFASDPEQLHLMWRDIALGKDGVTRRVSPLIDFDDPGCTQAALAALTSAQLHDPSQQGPCLGPLVHNATMRGAEAGDIALSEDGLTIAWTLTAGSRPNPSVVPDNFGQDAWVTSMAPGVSRKAGTRIVTRAATGPEPPATGASITEIALSDDGRRLALETQRTEFSSLTAPSPLGPFPGSTEVESLYRVMLAADRTPERIELVTRSFDGGELAGVLGGGEGLAFSGDGRTIAFDSGASNLTEDDSNGSKDVFVSVPGPSSCEFIPPPAACNPTPPPKDKEGGGGGSAGDVAPPALSTEGAPPRKTVQQLRKEARAKCRKKKGKARRRCLKRANSIGRPRKGNGQRR